METVVVDLGDRSYPIYIGADLLDQPDLLSRHIRGDHVFIVTDDNVAPLYLERVTGSLEGKNLTTEVLPAGESTKSLDTMGRCFDRMLETGCDRNTTVIALGGGVVGDIGGFAAACYQRGVAYLQVPTTLLSQVDSSVGGKTGVNHRLGKNMIGAFHQPACVIADTTTLSTLSSREIAAGAAEIIKYGAIVDEQFFSWLESHIHDLLALEPQVVADAVSRSCRSKSDVVSSDEREKGLRAILNFGHTFGHAIETGEGYGVWLHGEAVAAGMVMAAEMSMRCGWLEPESKERISALVRQANLPDRPPAGYSVERFINLMSVDKKVADNRIRLVLLKAIGSAVVTDDFDTKVLEECIEASVTE